MKRRGFLKFLATIAALPCVSPLAALCKPKVLPTDTTKASEWWPTVKARAEWAGKNEDLFGGVSISDEETMEAVGRGAADHYLLSGWSKGGHSSTLAIMRQEHIRPGDTVSIDDEYYRISRQEIERVSSLKRWCEYPLSGEDMNKF